MKFFIIFLMLFTNITGGAAPLSSDPVNGSVTQAFQHDFPGAETVSWSVSKDYYKASFLLNCQYVFAFYTKDGSLMATARNMRFTDLPVMLQTSMKELQNGYWITELFEISNPEGTTYYLTVENSGQKILLRSVVNGWEIYQKKSKD